MNQSLPAPDRSPPLRWWAEPQMVVALAALLTSFCAVAVGAYEAFLQRHHDRAEVWPRVEVGLWDAPKVTTVVVSNTGIGPARIERVDVTVNGKPTPSWDAVILAALGRAIPGHSQVSIIDHSLRGGDQSTVLAIGGADRRVGDTGLLGAVGMQICYTSVFDEAWIVAIPRLGGETSWRKVDHCTPSHFGDF